MTHKVHKYIINLSTVKQDIKTGTDKIIDIKVKSM